MVTLIQAAFPDCEAFGVVAPGRLQRIKIEFEQESRNFLKHGHNVNDCDMIVCWEHNWPECPLEVLELKREMMSGSLGPDREIGKERLTTEARRRGELPQLLPLINTDDTD